MKDQLGQELAIGDVVVYTLESSNGFVMEVGVVDSIHENPRLEPIAHMTSSTLYNSFTYSSCIIKIDIGTRDRIVQKLQPALAKKHLASLLKRINS